MDAGTTLHRHTLISSNPRAELRDRLAATSSQKIEDQAPCSSRLGGSRGVAFTDTEACTTNGPQCAAICRTSGTPPVSEAPSLAACDICERKQHCTRAYSARRRAFLPLAIVRLDGRTRGAVGGNTLVSHELMDSTLRWPSSTFGSDLDQKVGIPPLDDFHDWDESAYNASKTAVHFIPAGKWWRWRRQAR